jgi:hypothetical protein
MILKHQVAFDSSPDSVGAAVSALLSAFTTMAKSEGILSDRLKILHVRTETLGEGRSSLVTAFEINEDARPKDI